MQTAYCQQPLPSPSEPPHPEITTMSTYAHTTTLSFTPESNSTSPPTRMQTVSEEVFTRRDDHELSSPEYAPEGEGDKEYPWGRCVFDEGCEFATGREMLESMRAECCTENEERHDPGSVIISSTSFETISTTPLQNILPPQPRTPAEWRQLAASVMAQLREDVLAMDPELARLLEPRSPAPPRPLSSAQLRRRGEDYMTRHGEELCPRVDRDSEHDQEPGEMEQDDKNFTSGQVFGTGTGKILFVISDVDADSHPPTESTSLLGNLTAPRSPLGHATEVTLSPSIDLFGSSAISWASSPPTSPSPLSPTTSLLPSAAPSPWLSVTSSSGFFCDDITLVSDFPSSSSAKDHNHDCAIVTAETIALERCTLKRNSRVSKERRQNRKFGLALRSPLLLLAPPAGVERTTSSTYIVTVTSTTIVPSTPSSGASDTPGTHTKSAKFTRSITSIPSALVKAAVVLGISAVRSFVSR